jgi:hypothetical protein
MNLKTDLSTLVNGNTVSDMEEENNYGKMDQFTKDIGKITWLMEKED